jgi:hypothetical protein
MEFRGSRRFEMLAWNQAQQYKPLILSYLPQLRAAEKLYGEYCDRNGRASLLS